ncbi:MAG: protein-export chaperone SecB [Rickettsiales bacterium]|jgi:preprotein translocase subunit SecB|nr:protein-export chaperone SecB [Rickettsiales bacterium]
MEKNQNEPVKNSMSNGQDFAIIAQYLKDLSFESPQTPQVFFTKIEEQPQIEVNIDIQAKKINDNTFDVALKVRANNKLKDKTIFLIEVVYSAVVKTTAPKEIEEQILLIKVPELIFPFVRSIITSTTQDSGFPPFAMAPIDFNVLYQSRKKTTASDNITTAENDNTKK